MRVRERSQSVIDELKSTKSVLTWERGGPRLP